MVVSLWGIDWRALLASTETGRPLGHDYGSIHLQNALGLSQAVSEAGMAVDRDRLPCDELALFCQSSDLFNRLRARGQLFFGVDQKGAAHDMQPPKPDDPDLIALLELLKAVDLLPRPAPTPHSAEPSALTDQASVTPRPDQASVTPRPDYVTLDQAAAMIHKKKRTLERWKTAGKLPDPTVDGGGGKADYWEWSTIRPALMKLSGIKLPDTYPGNRTLH